MNLSKLFQYLIIASRFSDTTVNGKTINLRSVKEIRIFSVLCHVFSFIKFASTLTTVLKKTVPIFSHAF